MFGKFQESQKLEKHDLLTYCQNYTSKKLLKLVWLPLKKIIQQLYSIHFIKKKEKEHTGNFIIYLNGTLIPISK
jgi:hypothetical protein